MLLMLQASAALQTFCNSLIHSDVSTLLLEVCEWDAHSFTQWSMYQRAAESLLDLLAMPAVCALADAYGRRPLLLLTGRTLWLVSAWGAGTSNSHCQASHRFHEGFLIGHEHGMSHRQQLCSV